jgi:hypothetical protein
VKSMFLSDWQEGCEAGRKGILPNPAPLPVD